MIYHLRGIMVFIGTGQNARGEAEAGGGGKTSAVANITVFFLILYNHNCTIEEVI